MTIDKYWKDHLYNLDKLRQGINFRAYAQKDPLLEYKKEAFMLFEELLYNMNEELLIRIFHIVITLNGITTADDMMTAKSNQKNMQYQRAELINAMNKKAPNQENFVKQETAHNKVNPLDRDPKDPSTWGKIKRNDPCPCGSGKKYKQCCGKIE